jgi:ribonuclease J
VTGRVTCGSVFVDGLGVGDVGNIVLRDRQQLSKNGLMVVAITIEKGSYQIISGPDIVSRGFVYVREAEALIEDCKDIVYETVSDCLYSGVTDWNKLKNCIREALGQFLWERTKRNPMILPIISEI